MNRGFRIFDFDGHSSEPRDALTPCADPKLFGGNAARVLGVYLP